MHIKNFVEKPYTEIEIGDILESLDTGTYYLLMKTEKGKCVSIDLNKNKICEPECDSIEELIESTCDDYIVHKSENIEIIIK